MNQDSENLPPADDAPIAVLKDLEQETSADFIVRVRRKIERRKTASQFIGFSWFLPQVILVEIASIFKHLFTAIDSKRPRP